MIQFFLQIYNMDESYVSIIVEIILEIIKNLYYLTDETEIIVEFYITNFIKDTIFRFNKFLLGICLIQEFDKLLYSKINDDVLQYKFYEKDRIIVSQFANKVHNLLKDKKLN